MAPEEGGRGGAKKVAVVIGSGSVKCAAAIGLHNVLVREGIGVDMVVGCSAGSLFAALLAAGIEGPAAADMARRLWTRDLTSVKDRKAVLKMIFPRLFGFDSEWGLRNDAPAVKMIRQVYGDMRFETMKVPLYLAATDFVTGGQVILSSGSLVDAIRASIAIPFLLKPWRVGERLLVDGFMSDPLPVGVAMKEGANVIVAMGFESPMQRNVNSLARFSFQLSSIMTNNLLRSNFAFHNMAHHAEIIPVIPEFKQRVGLFDTAKIPYIIEEGERAAEEQVPYLRRLLG